MWVHSVWVVYSMSMSTQCMGNVSTQCMGNVKTQCMSSVSTYNEWEWLVYVHMVWLVLDHLLYVYMELVRVNIKCIHAVSTHEVKVSTDVSICVWLLM